MTMEEQKHYIAERAKTKHGAQISNHRAKKALKSKAHEAPLHLDPNPFDLDANHFKDENDLPVPQLAYTDTETEARGVALCTLDMAHHFLEQTSSISTDALALLFVDVHDADLIANSGLKPIVIPAKFQRHRRNNLDLWPHSPNWRPPSWQGICQSRLQPGRD